jgi:hypothetical protein
MMAQPIYGYGPSYGYYWPSYGYDDYDYGPAYGFALPCEGAEPSHGFFPRSFGVRCAA